MSLRRFAEFHDVDLLITDAGLQDDQLSGLEAADLATERV